MSATVLDILIFKKGYRLFGHPVHYTLHERETSSNEQKRMFPSISQSQIGKGGGLDHYLTPRED